MKRNKNNQQDHEHIVTTIRNARCHYTPHLSLLVNEFLKCLLRNFCKVVLYYDRSIDRTIDGYDNRDLSCSMQLLR